MNYKLLNARDLTPEHIALWCQYQQADASLGNPYFCPHYTQALAAVRNDVYVTLLEENGTTVGFFPFQRGKIGVGRPAGGALSDYQGVIAAKNIKWDAAALLRGSELNIWDFDHLLASQEAFAPFHRASATSPYLDLSNGYEAYAAARRAAGTEYIKKMGNLRRKLEREVGPLKFEAHEVNPTKFETLLAWKSEQCKSTGTVDTFSFDWTRQLLEKIMAAQTPEFAGMFSTLHVNDKLIAAHFGMRSKTVWHYWFPSYDHEFSKFSPGSLLLLSMAEHAPRIGIQMIDMGKGDAPYKLQLATSSIAIAEGCVEVASFASTLRKWRRGTETWLKNSPLAGIARYPGRLIRRLEKRLRFQ